MTPATNSSSPGPMIVKYAQSSHNGVQAIPLYRHAIGCVLKGRKYLHDGDIRREIRAGDLFYLCIGTHYIEDVPEGNRPFEQIVFYYDTQQMNKILHSLSLDHRIPIRNDHDCPECRERQNVSYPTWNVMKHFFHAVNQYLKEGLFDKDRVAEDLLMTQLVYLLTREEKCCLNTLILNGIDTEAADFEQIIHRHIFIDIPIEELAAKCNRSLTAFKKDFKRHFHDSPHRWFVRQRLMKARLLLISTGKPVSEVGTECTFPNTSHFIKLFKKEFGTTPVGFRRRDRARQSETVAQPA
jgi:AraC-like DNA-binding protein